MRTALVVPTIRPASLRHFKERWAGARWDDVVIVYDGPRSECPIEWPGAQLYCWDDYESQYGEHAWIFSRRDSACRAFGFLRAVARGAEVVITLDDDCYPTAPWGADGFAQAHLEGLTGAPRWTSSVPGMMVRGLPVGPGLTAGGPPALVNMGLWSGVPDLSAVETLAVLERGDGQQGLLTGFTPARGTRVMSPRQPFPFSGMNFSFRRGALPALYFPRMGERSPYSRFDDIWCGLLLQRICALTGDLITLGEPWVHHARASDVHENLRKEASGTEVNEHYWRVLSELSLGGGSIAECASAAARELTRHAEPYLAEWGRGLAIWVALSRDALAEAAGEPAVAVGRGAGASRD